MAQEIFDIKKDLRRLRRELKLEQKIPFTYKENKKYAKMKKNGENLPAGVHESLYVDGGSTNEFYTLYQADLNDREIAEYLAYKQIEMVRTIKNCVVFFTTLTVIGLVVGFLAAFM